MFWQRLLALLHRIKELTISFVFAQLVNQPVGGINILHFMEQFSQDINPCKFGFIGNEFFSSSAGPADIDCRKYSFFSNSSIQVNFLITGTFEFFKDYLIHSGASINQSSSNNSQTAAAFYISCCSKKSFWLF